MTKLSTVAATLVALLSGCSLRSMLPLRKPEARPVAYVANRSAGTVAVLDTHSREIATTIPVGHDPVALALGPDGGFAYVANRCGDDPKCEAYGTVAVVDTATNTLSATIALNYVDDTCQPSGIGLAPHGRVLYVASRCSGRFQPGLISVIDTTQNAVVASIQSPATPRDIAIAADGRFVYVSNVPSGVSIIDTASNTVSATLPDLPTGGGIATNGRFVYVASGCPSSDVRCSFSGVHVIDTATNTATTTIPLTGAPAGLASSPDGRFVYVLNTTEPAEDAVAVIDTATNQLAGSIRLGETFCRVAVSPDNRFAYASNCYTGRVAVIDTVAHAVAAMVPVAGSPCGIAVAMLGG